jgi:hypothetical protein
MGSGSKKCIGKNRDDERLTESFETTVEQAKKSVSNDNGSIRSAEATGS